MHAAPANRIITTAAIPAIHAISLVLLSFSNQNAPHSGRIALLLFPEWILLIKINPAGKRGIDLDFTQAYKCKELFILILITKNTRWIY